MLGTVNKNPGRVILGVRDNAKHKTKANIEQLRARDNKLIRGRFNYLEVPGGTLNFCYRAYKGDPVVDYSLKDGEIYEIPLGVARHLNTNVGRWEHKYLLDAEGKPSNKTSVRVRRCIFENMEFMDIEDIGSTQIEEVKVESIPSLKKK